MKSIKAMTIILTIVGAGMFNNADAQLESLVERYTGANADDYLEPLVTAFGANLNSGLYRNAHIPQSGLHIDLRINAMLALFSDNQKTFIATTEGYFRPVQEFEAPTVVGSGKGAAVRSPQQTEFTFPGGYELESFILAAPIVTVGSVAGTEASMRFFSANLSEDIGNLSLFGLGARHNISQYIPLSPVDLAAGFFYHNFKIGDIIESHSYIAHAEVSKSFSILELYGGLGYESTTASINYTFDALGQSEDVSIDITGKNKFRTTLGLALNFLMLHLNMDYNIGHQNLVNLGLSFGL